MRTNKKKKPAPIREQIQITEEDEVRELAHIIQDREFERESTLANSDRFVSSGHMGYVGPDE